MFCIARCTPAARSAAQQNSIANLEVHVTVPADAHGGNHACIACMHMPAQFQLMNASGMASSSKTDQVHETYLLTGFLD